MFTHFRIILPNAVHTPEIEYFCPYDNKESTEKKLFTYLNFTKKEDITNKIKETFPVVGGKLNNAFPDLKFEPNKSRFYKGVQYNNNKYPDYLKNIPKGYIIQPKEKKRMVAITQSDEYNWTVLIF